MAKIYIILGSVRPYRIGQQIAPLVRNLAAEIAIDDVEIIDLPDWPLAMDDEPDQPSKGVYAQQATRN